MYINKDFVRHIIKIIMLIENDYKNKNIELINNDDEIRKNLGELFRIADMLYGRT